MALDAKGEFVNPQDETLSRHHATIVVQANTYELASHPDSRLKVWINDLGHSKGVFVDGVRLNIDIDERRVLQEGQIVEFGTAGFKFKLIYYPIVICWAVLPPKRLHRVQSYCIRTDVKFVTKWLKFKCTHLLMIKSYLSEFCTMALVQGRPIIDESWLKLISSDNYLTQMEASFQLPPEHTHCPPVEDPHDDVRLYHVNPRRAKIFGGVHFIACEDTDDVRMFEKWIHFGGGVLEKVVIGLEVKASFPEVRKALDGIRKKLGDHQRPIFLKPRKEPAFSLVNRYSRTERCGRLVHGRQELSMAILHNSRRLYCNPYAEPTVPLTDFDYAMSINLPPSPRMRPTIESSIVSQVNIECSTGDYQTDKIPSIVPNSISEQSLSIITSYAESNSQPSYQPPTPETSQILPPSTSTLSESNNSATSLIPSSMCSSLTDTHREGSLTPATPQLLQSPSTSLVKYKISTTIEENQGLLDSRSKELPSKLASSNYTLDNEPVLNSSSFQNKIMTSRAGIRKPRPFDLSFFDLWPDVPPKAVDSAFSSIEKGKQKADAPLTISMVHSSVHANSQRWELMEIDSHKNIMQFEKKEGANFINKTLVQPKETQDSPDQMQIHNSIPPASRAQRHEDNKDAGIVPLLSPATPNPILNPLIQNNKNNEDYGWFLPGSILRGNPNHREMEKVNDLEDHKTTSQLSKLTLNTPRKKRRSDASISIPNQIDSTIPDNELWSFSIEDNITPRVRHGDSRLIMRKRSEYEMVDPRAVYPILNQQSATNSKVMGKKPVTFPKIIEVIPQTQINTIPTGPSLSEFWNIYSDSSPVVNAQSSWKVGSRISYQRSSSSTGYSTVIKRVTPSSSQIAHEIIEID
ncbi:hypothetical protein G9A89_015298 [Geosiphon pyriformis]|nr:hypothetical protein G9A89_015298 [Geosiphon pyriformis]